VDILFQADVTATDGRSVMEEWDEAGEKIPPFAGRLVEGVSENLPELDRVIGAHAEGWRVQRMAALDRTILRVACYELLYPGDVPVAVAIDEAVRAAIVEHRPTSVAVERVAWNKNQVSALTVARAIGVVLLAASQAGLEVEEYGPLEVKMAVTGVGNAAKDQVRAALERAHGLRGVPAQPDACDAVAVALCHMLQSRMRTLTRRAAAR